MQLSRKVHIEKPPALGSNHPSQRGTPAMSNLGENLAGKHVGNTKCEGSGFRSLSIQTGVLDTTPTLARLRGGGESGFCGARMRKPCPQGVRCCRPAPELKVPDESDEPNPGQKCSLSSQPAGVETRLGGAVGTSESGSKLHAPDGGKPALQPSSKGREPAA